MKTLYLVRHAKSSWKDPQLSDLQRPLNKRGHRNAPIMGERLARQNTLPDILISSPAKRAFTTARYIANEMGYDPEEIRSNKALYFNGLESILEVVCNTDESLSSVMLVGHNPDMTALLNYLCGFQTHNMPTCAAATIEHEGPWVNFSARSATLRHYDYPKKEI